MRCSKSIIYIDLAKSRQFLGEFGIVGFLFRVIAKILEEQHFARLGKHRFHFRSDTIRRDFDFHLQQLAQPGGARRETHLRIPLALRTAEM